MTNLRSFSDLFKAAGKLAVVCAFMTAMAVAASAQTNTYPSSGNVGVGTMTPTEPLEINKNQNAGTALAVDNGYTSGGNAAYSGFWFRQNGANRFYIGSVNDGNTTQIGGPGAAQFWNFANGPILFATNNSERIRLTSSGNFGIGTTSPATKFQVNYDHDSTTFVNGTDFTLLLRNNNTTTNNWVGFGFAGNRVDGTSRLAGTVGAQMTSHANGSFATDLVFNVTGAGESPVEVLRMKSSGNVGIGTTNPGSLLQLEGASRPTVTINNTAGTTRMRLTTAVLNWGGMTQNANFDGTNWNLDDTSLAGWINKVDSRAGVDVAAIGHLTPGANPRAYTELFTVLGSGKVGIGATNPAYKLDVSGEIRSSTGGFRFPDGSVQTTAATSSQWANGSSNINYTSGNVGIGTTAPGAKLEVDGSGVIRVTEGTRAVPTSGAGLELSANSTGSFVGAYNRSTSSYRRLYFYGSPYVFEGGNVGIGIENPQNKLHVGGSITVDGNINAKYQDLAEWVRSSEQISAGTVVVLDTTKSNQVTSSSVSYDTRVAGVISAQPGITLGESGEGKVLVATTGRVRVKVDASRAPIHIGDLIVTSDVPGMAMKSEPVEFAGRKMHMPGTIIGKALEPLAKGTGEILVLLSLQ